MVTPIGKVPAEGEHRPQVGRGRVTDRGEEACEGVRKYRPDCVAGHLLVKAGENSSDLASGYVKPSVMYAVAKAPGTWRKLSPVAWG